MNYRSHTREDIEAALTAGQEVWMLDTGNDGEDDVLIGTYEEVLADIQHHCVANLGRAIPEGEDLPQGWTLIRYRYRDA